VLCFENECKKSSLIKPKRQADTHTRGKCLLSPFHMLSSCSLMENIAKIIAEKEAKEAMSLYKQMEKGNVLCPPHYVLPCVS
jgi:hypothetical protein